MTKSEAYESLRQFVEYECYRGYDVPENDINDYIKQIEAICVS